MAAPAKKARAVQFQGARHTDSSLAEMKTGDIAALVAAMRGGNPPKPATKAKAIELFWKAAETLPKAPRVQPKAQRVADAKAEPLEATAEVRGAEGEAGEKAPRKAKRYSIAAGGAEAAESMLPQARLLVRSMVEAARPLTMAECAALLQVKKASRRPEKVVAWYFAKVLRPAGILVEERGR